jgi:nucleoside triphosphate diphosphatase
VSGGSSARQGAEAVERLDEITRRLRRECPWDRDQDARSIVPHTVEEAYELADAAQRGDDARMVDELGDVLFQVHFLSLLLEERGAADLAAVADHCREKLIRRHPHVFGEAEAESAAQVLRNWDRIKRETEGGGEPFGELPQTLPALTHARKLQRRAASAYGEGRDHGAALAALREAADSFAAAVPEGASAAPTADPEARDRVERALGELLFCAVDLARRAQADPELALRATAERFRRRVEEEAPQ